MRITTLTVKDFKRVRDVTITPDADRALILIGGKNGAGKSSTLDALSAAFGGKRAVPSDPVRHGADSAEVVVELDGELTIRRVIQPDGESTLEIRDKMGARRAPQQIVDGLISGRFLDPLQFLSLPAKEQRAQLMRMIPDAKRIADLDEKRERAFDKRTDVGRDLGKAEGELARLPVVEVGTPIDVGELAAETKRFAEQEKQLGEIRREREQAERTAREHDADRARVDAEIEQLKARLAGLIDQSERLGARSAELRSLEAETAKRVDAATIAWDASAERRAQIEADLSRAGEHNRTVNAAESQAKRRIDVASEVDRLTTERDNLTKLLGTIDQRKAEILAAAKLPVEGLGVSADGITLAGVPFVQASGAEKMRVALALAIAASPNLDDIWVRDAALLDEDSLAAVEEQAKAAGKSIWLERVGDQDPGVIVIRDGKVAS